MKHIVYLNETGRSLATRIQSEFNDFRLTQFKDFNEEMFVNSRVRSNATLIKDKYTDPAVICVDSIGRNVISVLSGHIGGANAICVEIAHLIGAHPVITTQSDNIG